MVIKKLSADLKNPIWIYAKAIMFLLIAIIAITLVIVESRSMRISLLLVISIWACCRLYYFAFYVIENYVDPNFKFASLTGFMLYLLSPSKRVGPKESDCKDAELE